jgi:hypothetical protein
MTIIYPCDAGTGWPMGYHRYAVTEFGVCCSLCGKRQPEHANTTMEVAR